MVRIRSDDWLAVLILAVMAGGSSAGMAATRTGTLAVTLTITSSCIVRTNAQISAARLEQAFLNGVPLNQISVRCSAATPYFLALERPTRRFNRAIVADPTAGAASLGQSAPNADTTPSLVDAPERLIAQPTAAPVEAKSSSFKALDEIRPDKNAENSSRLVITY